MQHDYKLKLFPVPNYIISAVIPAVLCLLCNATINYWFVILLKPFVSEDKAAMKNSEAKRFWV